MSGASWKHMSEPSVPAEDGLVFHVVVDVHVVEKIWTFYIVFDAGATDISADAAEERPGRIVQVNGAKVTLRDAALCLRAVIEWADGNSSVCSAEVYVKRCEDHIVRTVNCLLRVVISKPPDELPAIDLESTFVIVVSEFVIFDCRIIKTEFQSVLLIEAKDLCAVKQSIFGTCYGIVGGVGPWSV